MTRGPDLPVDRGGEGTWILTGQPGQFWEEDTSKGLDIGPNEKVWDMGTL